jgi:hypothetical protein
MGNGDFLRERKERAYIYIYIEDVSSEKGISYVRVRGFIINYWIKFNG